MMAENRRTTLLRLALAGLLALNILALYQLARYAESAGLLHGRRALALLGALGLAAALELVLLVLSWTGLRERLFALGERLLSLLSKIGRWNLAVFALLVAAYGFALLGPVGEFLGRPAVRFFLFAWLALAGSGLLAAAGLRRSWGELLLAALLLAGAGYKALSFLPEISTDPFTLYWSEASRYYYASLYFAKSIYGFATPPTVLHPSRYLMQSLPYLIPHSPIWLHRAWQVFLWVAVTALTAYVLLRRLQAADSLRRWAVAAWVFLFLLLGPVYYHLQVPLILVIGLLPRRNTQGMANFWKGLLVVLLASAWAGISRVNWFPVPGMLAAALYFLEEPVQQVAPARPGQDWKAILRYLWRPAAWAILGTLVAFGAQTLYVLWSGNNASEFTSSFSSDLLWYRLFPNSTYPLGILISALIVSLPLLAILAMRLAGRQAPLHFIRTLGLGAILLVLFAGGLVVSVKIGGGSNLHNLDAYLALLMVMAAYAFFRRIQGEPRSEEPGGTSSPVASGRAWRSPQVEAVILAAAALIPVYFAVLSGGPPERVDPEVTQKALTVLKKLVPSGPGAGEVLFLGNRQLLTFGELPGIKLVPEYERVFLMEMAMAGNPDYLGRFHQELKDHRFAMIVSEPIFVQYKNSDEIFGEENNAWVNQVSKYVWCYYEPQRLLRDVRIQLLVPRAEPGETCP